MSQEMQTISATKGNSRTLQGKVVSDAMQKTIVVSVERTYKHPTLGKVMRSSKKYKAHDEQSTARVGDVVEIQETRPLSKTKHMALIRIIKKAE